MVPNNGGQVPTSGGTGVQQRTQYYPSGLPWVSGSSDEPIFQPYKYNGKEFVETHGYDTYDYGARGYYAAIGRFTTPDPLCEKYYSISPYSYCGGNAVNRIDPNGMDVWTTTDTDEIAKVLGAFKNGVEPEFDGSAWYYTKGEDESVSVGLNYTDGTSHFYLGTGLPDGGIGVTDLGRGKLKANPNSHYSIYGDYNVYSQSEIDEVMDTYVSIAGAEFGGAALGALWKGYGVGEVISSWWARKVAANGAKLAAKTVPKALNQFNSAESLIQGAGNLTKVKAGLQGFVKGDGSSIFKAITNGGKLQSNGQILMENGMQIGNHISSTTGIYTIHITPTVGKMIKIRIIP